MNKLAIFGGPKAIKTQLRPYNSIGIEEADAVKGVIESGVLSKFLGTWSPDFYGGEKVKEFERDCEEFFGVKHAITVNSWTSGLTCAVGAIGIEPGDEVIVTTWTMCATATAILHWNAIPVFADIDPLTFNLDPQSVEANITPYTKAIIAVDIFGHPADIDSLMEIANRYNLKLITDSAQAPGSTYKGSLTGTASHVGGYSLNYHKHIHTGEGGILVTNDNDIADRLRLIRNHAEAVVEGMGVLDISNMVGYNYRLGELECAIGIEQLKKLPKLVSGRQKAAEKLAVLLGNLNGIRMPVVMPDCTHSYYMFPMVLDIELIGVSRDRIIEALNAEGVIGLTSGYVNIHLLPMYQKKIAYGSSGFPWTSDICKREVDYGEGICPVAEELHRSTYMGLSACMHEMSDNDVDAIAAAFIKVWSNLDQL
ncbi:DegT/DnrJ/EryC1/StrS family aminotransferase [Amylibacter sp.]|jgi:perosamine synthetase|nr:DegT/DnrJ/EryC1/StrS family aminotransferase [Amylibacter sp.]